MPCGCANCGSCAECCFRSCLSLPSDRYEQKDYAWVDLEEVIKKIAWRELKDFPPAGLTLAERCRPLTSVLALDLDKATIQVSVPKPDKERSASSTTSIPKAENNVQVLFQSTFANKTGNNQVYSFKSERQTTSFVEISLQRGFTIGSSLDLEVKAPVGSDEETEGFRGRLGCRLQWSFRRGEVTRKEDRVSWCVDNQITVSSNNTGTATLSIDERATSSDFSLTCAINALDTQLPPTRSGQKAKVDPTQPSAEGDKGWLRRALKTVSCVKGGSSHTRDHDGDMQITMKEESDRSEDDEERKDTRLDREDGIEDQIEPEESQRLSKENSRASSPPKKAAAPPPMKTLPKVVVLVRRKSSPKVIKVVRIALSKICEECPDFFTMPDKSKGTGVIYCDLKGRCHAVFAIEQIVKLEECEFVQEEQPIDEQPTNGEPPSVHLPSSRSSEDNVQPRPPDNYRSTYTSRRNYFNY